MRLLCDRDVADQYVLGTLPDAEAELFEEHFFDCRECAARVSAQTLLSGEGTVSVSRGGKFRLCTPRNQVIVGGSLAQAATLVSHGNAALVSRQALQVDAWSRLSTFNTANSVRFVRYGRLSLRQRVAASPEEWFTVLRRLGATALQLRVHARRSASCCYAHRCRLCQSVDLVDADVRRRLHESVAVACAPRDRKAAAGRGD